VADVQLGVGLERFALRPEQVPSAPSLIGGSVASSLLLVLEGHRAWRDAGSDKQELVLRALGVSKKEARRLATAPLPPLASAPRG